MSLAGRVTFVLLWFASLMVVGALVSAQTRRAADPGEIISGNDIGFRPQGWDGKARTGTFMVRIHGEWVEAKDVIGVVHTTK